MAKKAVGFIKLHVPGGQANPAPPVGPALGAHGVPVVFLHPKATHGTLLELQEAPGG